MQELPKHTQFAQVWNNLTERLIEELDKKRDECEAALTSQPDQVEDPAPHAKLIFSMIISDFDVTEARDIEPEGSAPHYPVNKCTH